MKTNSKGNTNEQQYPHLIEIIPDIVYKINPEGHFTFVNKHIKLLGYNQKELIGKHFSEILHPDEIETVSRSIVLGKLKKSNNDDEKPPLLFDERRTGTRMTKWLEIRLKHKKWEENKNNLNKKEPLILIGEIAARGIYDKSEKSKSNDFIGTVGIIRDITEKKKAEEEKRKLELQYFQAQRLESIGLIAGGIAHDFKNFLTIAIGYIEIVLDKYKFDGNISISLGKAMEALQRCKKLTQQLLSFSKAKKPVRKSTSMISIVKNSSHLILSGSKVQCTHHVGNKIWSVEVDEGQIAQVIENLVINAKHAMPEGGLIEITIKNETVKPENNLPLKKGKYVKTSVVDHGIGISEDHLDKVFDPFFTTKQEGSGLGLATTYSIINKHNGHITVESKLGEGSSFHIYLPAHTAKKTSSLKKKN